MKVKVKFQELVKALGYVNSVLSDKALDDKMKNIIFLVNKDKVEIVGTSSLIFSRTLLEEAEVEDVEEEWSFQLKASDLNGLVSSFTNLYKTHVDEIELMEEGVKIKAVVHEIANEEKDSSLNNDIKYLFDSSKIGKNTFNEIHSEFPENCECLKSGELLVYIDSLMPLMTGGASGGVASKLYFAEDYVFVLSSATAAFFRNMLPEDVLSDVTLGMSSVSFLKRMADVSEMIEICKTENFVCARTGNTVAFIKYKPVNIKYKIYIEKLTKDKGVVLDRLYLKDVLKRLGTVSPDCIVEITEDGEMLLNNGSIDQTLPLVSEKEAKDVKFKMSVPVFEKSILGIDSISDENVFLYFVPRNKIGYTLYLMDKTNTWLSNTQVRRA